MANPLKKERSWLLTLFGLPFFLVGAGFLWVSIIPTLNDVWRMSHWQSTQAELLHARLVSHSSSKGGTTYNVEANYRYEVDNQPYQNTRVAVNSGNDNIGSFQEGLGRQLEKAYAMHQAVNVWYDPSNPADAILNRDVRWGLLALKSVFVVVFGGFGFTLIYFGMRGIAPSPDISANSPQPWLNNPDWAGGVLRYQGKTKVYSVWIFALLWCSISSFPLFNFTEIWQKQGWVVLLVLLFPLVGIGLLYHAVKTTLEWRRFGETPLRLDPFPGQIGGIVGGDVLLRTHLDPRANFKVTLSCLRSYMSGSGEDRSRSEKLIWQDSSAGHCQAAAEGVRLQFRFVAPDNLPESETQKDDYHLWRLNIQGNMRGVDLQRDFEIPMYRNVHATAHSQELITDIKEQNQQRYRIEELLPINQNGLQTDIYYPPFRKPLQAFGILLFGAIFCGSGLFLWHQAGTAGFMSAIPYFMSVIFNLVGIIIAICGIYSLLNSLRVSCDGRQVTSTRRMLGIVLSQKSAMFPSITMITIKNTGSSSSGNQHTAHYEVQAITSNGKLLLAEQIDAYSKAEFVADYFRRLSGVKA